MTGILSIHPQRLLARTTNFLSGGSFPAFAICALLFYQIFVVVMAFSPPATGVWGEFMEDFRLRCFRITPSGGMEMGSVWVMVSEPIPLQAIFLFIWRTPLLELWRMRRRALIPLSASALLLVAAIAISLLGLGRSQAKQSTLPFPADRLRSDLLMPAFALTNQDGEPVSLDDFKGRVVIVTAVYAACTSTCPMMLSKIRSVLDELTAAERNELAVVAFSLSPEADTRELRKMISRMYSMDSPRFHFVNGVPGEVNALLDQLNVARTRDEKTGQIMHSNLFFLLDRDRRIGYRLSLSENEQPWLIEAVRALLREKAS